MRIACDFYLLSLNLQCCLKGFSILYGFELFIEMRMEICCVLASHVCRRFLDDLLNFGLERMESPKMNTEFHG